MTVLCRYHSRCASETGRRTMSKLIFLITAVYVAEGFDYVSQLPPTTNHARSIIKPLQLGHDDVDDILIPPLHRNGIKGKERVWPNGVIPYVFKTAYPNDLKQIILKTMQTIQENTCITFKARSNEANYIAIAAHPKGGVCSSYVGVKGTGEQVVYLSHSDQGTCVTHPVVMHELMHAIGLDHEHNRLDRDQYVTIRTGNVSPDKTHNFNKVDDITFFDFGCPYTYESVMHYDKTSFGKSSGLVTMQTKDPRFSDVIGNMKTAHPNDYEKINRIYGCNASKSSWTSWLKPWEWSWPWQSKDKTVAGHTCRAKPATPCKDDPTAPCAQVAGKCQQYPAWSVYCRKTCNTCVA